MRRSGGFSWVGGGFTRVGNEMGEWEKFYVGPLAGR